MTEPSFLRTTRAAYDLVAADYAQQFSGELTDKPLERALFAAFAELVTATLPADDPGPVADLGCGPGHITARLNDLGINAFGIDLSPEMVGLARQAYPELRFEEGSMTALDLPDGTLRGIIALYSTIHIPPAQLPDVFAEFHRVLAPGGQVMLAFQVGDEHKHRDEAFGHAISLDYYLRRPDQVAQLLSEAGLVVHAQLLREPEAVAEKVPRAFLLAQKPSG